MLRDHPLVGTVWDVRAREQVGPEEVARRAFRSRFVLLGVKHDNPDHHRLQAWVLEKMTEQGRRPIVALEMLSPDVEPLLRDHLKEHPGDAAGVGPAVRWEDSGWPPYESYLPIFEVALAHGLELVPASLGHGELERVRSNGLQALAPEVHDELGDAVALGSEEYSNLAAAIREAHCGVLPEEVVESMVPVQRARDARMAQALLSRASDDGGVLIAGGRHAALDVGVPRLLRGRLSPDRALSVGFLEVSRDVLEPALESDDGVSLPYDLVWFTPRVDETDPCDRYREQLERLARPESDSTDP